MLLLVLLCLLGYVFYLKFIIPCQYWQRKNVFHVKPWVRFFKVFVEKKSFAESVKEAYDKYPDRRYFGSFQFLYPSLFLRDLELIKQITVKDFEYFPDHLVIFNNGNDVVANSNLFSLKGEKWRNLRSTLSPAFTSSKMKSMFVLMNETAENFTKHLLNRNENFLQFELKDLYSKYTNDIIASCAFGITCDSLKEEKNDFFTMGKNITSISGATSIKALIIAFFPKLSEILSVGIFSSSVTNFFRKIIKDTITYREKEGIIRPDMVHLLLEARKGNLKFENSLENQDTGYATVEESSLGKSNNSKVQITDDIITAQALIFFFAGFETSSTLLSFASYELALNPDIQKKLHEEIDSAIFKCNGKITYEELLKLKYLDQVLSETLRLYPPGFALNRLCVKDYEIPPKLENETPLTINKDCAVVIPVFGIHRDPKYFPDPEKFNPDRFSDENKSSIIPGSYMPFGCGPRNCIGSRFALLETKSLLVSMLSKFEIEATKKTVIPIRLAKAVSIGSKDGFWLGLRKRKLE